MSADAPGIVGPPPVGPTQAFAVGIGPGMQVDFFEIDKAGQVYAQPVMNLFGHFGPTTFINSDVTLRGLTLEDQGAMGFFVGANGQSYLIDVLNVSNPLVFDAAMQSLRNPLAVIHSSNSGGVINGSGSNINAPPFNGDLPFNFTIQLVATDPGGAFDSSRDVANLSGKGTITFVYDGAGVEKFSAAFTLKQDRPLTPPNSLFPIDYSGSYNIEGEAEYKGGGYYGGPPDFTFSGGGSDQLELAPGPDWSLFVSQGLVQLTAQMSVGDGAGDAGIGELVGVVGTEPLVATLQ